MGGCFCQVEPWFDATSCRTEWRNLSMRTQRANPFACPAIAVAGAQPVPVQDTCDQVVIGNACELADGLDCFGGCAVTLTAPSAWQAKARMGATDPMDDQDDLARSIRGLGIDVGDDLANEGTYDTLLEACIGGWRIPDGLQIISQPGEGYRRDVLAWNSTCVMDCNPGFDLRLPGKRGIPSCLQLPGHQTVCRIGGVILPECPISIVARCLKVSAQSLANLVALQGCFGLCFCRSFNGAGPDDLQQRFFDGVVDTQSAKGNALRFTIVELAATAGIAWYVVFCTRVAGRQLAAAAAASHQAGQQSVAMLRA